MNSFEVEMVITSAKYVTSPNVDGVFKNEAIHAIINGKECSVPLAPGNTDYAEIMRQVDAGELTIEPADE